MTHTTAVHILPVGNGEPVHAALPDCWCQPLEVRTNHGHQYQHHAKDCRERFERQGLEREGNAWVLILGLSAHHRTAITVPT